MKSSAVIAPAEDDYEPKIHDHVGRPSPDDSPSTCGFPSFASPKDRVFNPLNLILQFVEASGQPILALVRSYDKA